jgi:hypothetical protein
VCVYCAVRAGCLNVIQVAFNCNNGTVGRRCNGLLWVSGVPFNTSVLRVSAFVPIKYSYFKHVFYIKYNSLKKFNAMCFLRTALQLLLNKLYLIALTLTGTVAPDPTPGIPVAVIALHHKTSRTSTFRSQITESRDIILLLRSINLSTSKDKVFLF